MSKYPNLTPVCLIFCLVTYRLFLRVICTKHLPTAAGIIFNPKLVCSIFYLRYTPRVFDRFCSRHNRLLAPLSGFPIKSLLGNGSAVTIDICCDPPESIFLILVASKSTSNRPLIDLESTLYYLIDLVWTNLILIYAYVHFVPKFQSRVFLSYPSYNGFPNRYHTN